MWHPTTRLVGTCTSIFMNVRSSRPLQTQGARRRDGSVRCGWQWQVCYTHQTTHSFISKSASHTLTQPKRFPEENHSPAH
jgi:hypothetical protein